MFGEPESAKTSANKQQQKWHNKVEMKAKQNERTEKRKRKPQSQRNIAQYYYKFVACSTMRWNENNEKQVNPYL